MHFGHGTRTSVAFEKAFRFLSIIALLRAKNLYVHVLFSSIYCIFEIMPLDVNVCRHSILFSGLLDNAFIVVAKISQGIYDWHHFLT